MGLRQIRGTDLKAQTEQIDWEETVLQPDLRGRGDLPGQMSFMDTVSDKDIINELLEVSVDSITPIKALNILSDLQQKVKNRW